MGCDFHAVPNGATLIEQGVVIGGVNYDEHPENLNLNKCDQQQESNNIAQNAYMMTLTGLSANRHRNVRAYVTYQLNGKNYTKYSSAVVHIETTNDNLTTSTVVID